MKTLTADSFVHIPNDQHGVRFLCHPASILTRSEMEDIIEKYPDRKGYHEPICYAALDIVKHLGGKIYYGKHVGLSIFFYENDVVALGVTPNKIAP